MKLTEVFAKKTYRERRAPSVDVGHLSIKEYQDFIQSLKLEPITQAEVAEFPWHPIGMALGAGNSNFMQTILSITSKGWDIAKIYRTPQGVLLMQVSGQGDWTKSKIKWSNQRLLSHLGRWWNKDEIQTN